MTPLFIDTIGYIALITNLYSMSKNSELKLRLLSLIANSIYIVYGILMNAFPIIIGGSIAVLLHAYHLKRLKNVNNKTC